MWRQLWVFTVVCSSLMAWRCTSNTTSLDAGTHVGSLDAGAMQSAIKVGNLQNEPTVALPHVVPLPVCEETGMNPLEAAQKFFDRGDFEKALPCAAQAAALEPHSVEAQVEKANALAALEKNDEAKLAYAHALALDSNSLDALMGAAHFYGVALPSSRDFDLLASLYAERGFDEAINQKDAEMAVSFARISAMVFNDLGQAKDALERAEFVLSKIAKDQDAQYERALALFELCRFKDAKSGFTALLNDRERSAHAYYHLALIEEREGKANQSEKHFAQAASIDLADFKRPVILAKEEFQSEVDKVLSQLSDDMKKDVGAVPISVEDVPEESDLMANEPPLSPTILGLFRGPPLKEVCTDVDTDHGRYPCRSIVLYRKNLGRAVESKEELKEQIRVTLLHEIGHLRGEDDGELAARGLE